MHSGTHATRSGSPGIDISVLATADRRRVLAVLGDTDGPLSEERLARRLEASATGVAVEAATPAACRKRRIQLRHAILPALTASGLVERAPGGIELSREDWWERGLEGFDGLPLSEPAHPAWDALVALERAFHGQRLLECFAAEPSPRPVGELARELAAAGEGDIESIQTRLSHADIPRLADLDVLEFDRETRAVRPGSAFDTVRAYVE